MVLPDVNVLVYAHREDSILHSGCKNWLESVANGSEAFGLADIVLSGFIRVVTHPRVFSKPSPLADALTFANQLRNRPNCVPVTAGVRHWDIFCNLCQEVEANGNLVPDAFLAAMAIESGSEWITTDRDFSRFNKLRWRHPLK